MTRYSMTICAVAALVLAALMTGVGGCGRTETTDKPEKPTRSEKKLQLARDGEALYAIVRGKSPSEAENLAAKELGEYLKKITGAEFPVATEGAALPKPHGIYLGWTEFATAQGIKPETLGEEEWVLRTAGDDLILTGGRRRGTLYAVYEFLERDLGCHWLAWDCEVVPSDRNLAVSSPNKNGKPAFSAREIYIATERFGGGEAKRNYKDMRLRNRSYLTWQPEIGGYLVYPPGRAQRFTSSFPRKNGSRRIRNISPWTLRANGHAAPLSPKKEPAPAAATFASAILPWSGKWLPLSPPISKARTRLNTKNTANAIRT